MQHEPAGFSNWLSRSTAAVVALLLLSCPLPVAGQTVHVNNQLGNDRFDGLAAQPSGRNVGPVETIGRATRIAGTRGRIVVANTGQPYYENVALFGYKNSGTARQPFRIEGQGAVLDGTIPVPDDAWENVEGALFRFKPTRLAPQVLYQEGRPLEQVKKAAEAIARPRIEPRQWCYDNGYIYFRVEEKMLPDRYQLRYAGHGAGILLNRVDHVEISGLVIQGFQFDGIQVKDAVSDIRLTGLNLRGNGRSGISIAGASEVTVSDSLIGNNGRAQVLLESPAKASFDNCDVLDNTAEAFVMEGGKLLIDGKPHEPGASSSR